MEPLSTNPDDFCFFDTETRALPGLEDARFGDVTKTSTGQYARSSKVIMFQYAVGNAEPKVWELRDFDSTLRWLNAPPDLLEFQSRALRGEAWFVAWNSAFDRQVVNRGMVRPSKRLIMPIRTVLDASAQGAAANLPMQLGRAHKMVGGEGKLPVGKSLIELFCRADGATPQEKPEEWRLFCEYGLQDIVALRDTFQKTRPLWRWEWEQFWASEVINDRGLPIDRRYVERAAYLSELYQAEVNERVKTYTRYDKETGEGCWSVNQHVALAKWVYDQLEHIPAATSVLTKTVSEDDEGRLIPDKISLDRKRVEKLIPLLERRDAEIGLTDEEFDVLQLLETREYGASATPKKFGKMLGMMTAEDDLPNQYVFNGAQQTGRFSARGVQTHNLTRKALSNEEAAIAAICEIAIDHRYTPARGAGEAGEDEDV
jgi:hypothetical protein